MKFELDPDKAASAIERAASSLHKSAVGLVLVISALTGLGAVLALILILSR